MREFPMRTAGLKTGRYSEGEGAYATVDILRRGISIPSVLIL